MVGGRRNKPCAEQTCAARNKIVTASVFGRSCAKPAKVAVNRRVLSLLSVLASLVAFDAQADTCPTAKDEIATDRPDVTNSSIVVPMGSFQSESGANFSANNGSRVLDGADTRWRLGVGPCLELLVDLPTS